MKPKWIEGFQLRENGTCLLISDLLQPNLDPSKIEMIAKQMFPFTTKNGQGLLHLAAQGNHFDVIKALIEHTQVPINQLNKDGQTCLDIFAKVGSSAHIQELVEKYEASGNYTMLCIDTKEKGEEELFQLFEKQYIQLTCDQLMKTAPDLNFEEAVIKSKYLLLMEAIKIGRIEFMKAFLKENRALFNYQDKKTGLSLLMQAIKEKNINMFTLFLENGGNEFMHQSDKDGLTPLMYAIETRNANIVDLCLKNGGSESIHQFDNDGWTAFLHAQNYNINDIIQLLLEKEATFQV